MYINATQLRVGMVFKDGEGLFRVTYAHHVTPGNKRGFVQTKFRNLDSGTQYERRFSSEDKIERVSLDHREMEYLYEDRDEFFFMDPKSHEQMSLSRETVGDFDKFMKPNKTVEVVFHNDKAISVELPSSVTLEVTRTVPGLKHATATSSSKPATLETGLVVQVPQFVNEGDAVRVDTSTGGYVERVKE